MRADWIRLMIPGYDGVEFFAHSLVARDQASLAHNAMLRIAFCFA
jgi:hypothetical protein